MTSKPLIATALITNGQGGMVMIGSVEAVLSGLGNPNAMFGENTREFMGKVDRFAGHFAVRTLRDMVEIVCLTTDILSAAKGSTN